MSIGRDLKLVLAWGWVVSAGLNVTPGANAQDRLSVPGQPLNIQEKPEGPAVPRIAYLANAGVHVNASDKELLIDALFRKGDPEWARLDPGTLEHIETAGQPFERIKLVLVSQSMPDHFDAVSVGRFLFNVRGASLIASPKVVDLLREGAPDFSAIKDRVHAASPDESGKAEQHVNGINVEVLRLARSSAENGASEAYGFIVRFPEKTLLHVGDAELNDKTRTVLASHAVGLDAACVPYWWLLNDDGRTFVENVLKPKAMIAIHVPPARAEELYREIRSKAPRTTVFYRSFESRRL